MAIVMSLIELATRPVAAQVGGGGVFVPGTGGGGSITNLPSYVITNNDAKRPVTLPYLEVTGGQTNTGYTVLNGGEIGGTIKMVNAFQPNALFGTGPTTNIIPLLIGSGLSSDGVTLSASGTPGGNAGAVQYNQSGVHAGTNDFRYDPTNGRVALNLGATRPNTAFEIGGSGAQFTQIRAGGSSTTKTNFFDSDGVGQFGDAALKIYVNGGPKWYFDPSPRYALHPLSPGFGDIGTFTDYVGSNWIGVTISSAYGTRASQVTGAGSGGTNFTLTADMGYRYAMGGSNVNISAIMGTAPSLVMWPKLVITNLTGTPTGLGFSSVTNRWRFSGVHGTNAPSSITNRVDLAFECDGTNCTVVYAYFSPAQ